MPLWPHKDDGLVKVIVPLRITRIPAGLNSKHIQPLGQCSDSKWKIISFFKSKYMFQIWPSAFPQLFPGCCSKKSRNVLLKIIADGARFSFPLYPILAMQVLTSDGRHKTADKDHLGSNMNNLLFLAFQYCSSIESGRQGRSILVMSLYIVHGDLL